MRAVHKINTLFSSAPFLPTSIAGLKLWLAADRITGLNDGDAVGTWSDLSGNGNDASQATGSKKPVYKVNIINGKPVVTFDGVDDVLLTAAAVQTSLEFTMIAVLKLFSSGTQIPLSVHSSGGYSFFISAAQRKVSFNGVASVVDGDVTTNFEIWSALRLSPNTTWFVNGGSQSVTGGTSTPSAASGVSALGARGDADLPSHVSVAEWVVFNQHIGTANRGLVEKYLGTKYGITVS